MAHSLEAAFVLPLTLITLSGALLMTPKILRVERSDARQLALMSELRCNADVLYGRPAYSPEKAYERKENLRFVRASPRRLIEGIRVAGDVWRLAREKDETLALGPPALPLPPGHKPIVPWLAPAETPPALPASGDGGPGLPQLPPNTGMSLRQEGPDLTFDFPGLTETLGNASGGQP